MDKESISFAWCNKCHYIISICSIDDVVCSRGGQPAHGRKIKEHGNNVMFIVPQRCSF